MSRKLAKIGYKAIPNIIYNLPELTKLSLGKVEALEVKINEIIEFNTNLQQVNRQRKTEALMDIKNTLKKYNIQFEDEKKRGRGFLASTYTKPHSWFVKHIEDSIELEYPTDAYMRRNIALRDRYYILKYPDTWDIAHVHNREPDFVRFFDDIKDNSIDKTTILGMYKICKLHGERAKKKEDEQRIKGKRENLQLVELCGRYNIDINEDYDDIKVSILDNILDRNKYLNLAHHLKMNRGDWSDGCRYAKQGLNDFTIESEIDGRIYSDIFYYIENWEGDGRVFRDCAWNYDTLFHMVNEQDGQLLIDYNKVYEMVENELF